MIKTRAAVLREMGLPAPYAVSRPLQIDTIDLAPPGPGELLVKVTAAGLCHSDLSVIDGTRPRVMPMALGHEAAATVVECGAGVSGYQPGDAVVFSFVPACGHCQPCATGRAALCEPGAKANVAGTLLSGARRLQFPNGGVEINHHLGVSGFAEYAVVAAASAVKIRSGLAPEIAALFGCAVLTGVGAVVNTARVTPGSTVAVFGLGGVGLAALLGARAAGAGTTVAIDLLDSKLELAKSLGATHVINAKASADVVAAIREATHGGAEFSFESVGNERVLQQGYAATARGGTTVTMGLPHPSKQFTIPAVSLTVEERTVKGSYMGSAVPSRDIPRFVAMYDAGLLPVDRLLTHRLRLEDINEGFDVLARGEAVRQVVLF